MALVSPKPSRGFWPAFLMAAVIVTLSQIIQATEDSPAQTVSVIPAPRIDETPALGGSIPGYDYDIENGLLATVTALNFVKPEIKNERTMVLKRVEGCSKEIEVQVMWQDGKAPLAVLLLGFTSRSKSPMAQIWKAQLFAAGCNVMTFDSPFLPAFNKRSRHGVAGNLDAESHLAGNVISAFLKTSDARSHVTKVGIVGGSYGALLALNIVQEAKQGKSSFSPDRVLALSPPVSIKTAAEHLDKFHSEDRWDYDLAKLAGDLQGLTPEKALRSNFPDSEYRAGIAAAFRIDLSDIVLYTDDAYKLKLLPFQNESDDSHRESFAETWTFSRYMTEMCFPYWQSKGKVSTVDQLLDMGDCRLLMRDLPDSVTVVIAQDDPLNDPAELSALKSSVSPSRLLVLPRGGHMGYISSKWCETLIKNLFK